MRTGAVHLPFDPPQGVALPSWSDPIVSTVGELRAALPPAHPNLTSSVSLRLNGTITLDGTFPGGVLVDAGRSVTLWSDEGATIDANGGAGGISRRAFHVRTGGQLLLKGIDVVNGRMENFFDDTNQQDGGCILVSSMSWLGMSGGQVADCFAIGRGGGMRVKDFSTLLMHDVTIARSTTHHSFDAEGGGLCVSQSRAVLEAVRFVDCTARSDAGWAEGGALSTHHQGSIITLKHVSFINILAYGHRANGGAVSADAENRLFISDSVFVNTTADGAFAAVGGGLRLLGVEVNMKNVEFVNSTCKVRRGSSPAQNAWGGGLSIWGGKTEGNGLTFRGCRAIVERAGGLAYGAGIGVGHPMMGHETSVEGMSGQARIRGAQFFGNYASVTEHGFAFGGGVANLGGRLELSDAEFMDCGADGGISGFAGGGSVASGGVSSLSLTNATLRTSWITPASGPVSILTMPPAQLEFTFLTLDEPCPSGEHKTFIGANFDLCPMFNSRSYDHDLPCPKDKTASVLIRNSTFDHFDASGCSVREDQVDLVTCESPGWDICGPKALCSMSDSVFISTPTCACLENDVQMDAFQEWVPSPLASSSAAAPYTDGCVEPGLADLNLNQNRWRATDRTRDISDCSGANWYPGDPTPCKGGTNSSDYCKPGMTGPLCHVCQADENYFNDISMRCYPCPPALSRGTGLLLILFLLVSGAALVKLIANLWSSRRQWAKQGSSVERLVTKMERTALYMSQVGFMANIKIVYGFTQVAVSMSEVLSVPFPRMYVVIVKPLQEFMNLLAVDLAAFTCVASVDVRLDATAGIPWGLLAGVVLIQAVSAAPCTLAALSTKHHPRAFDLNYLFSAVKRSAIDSLPVLLAALFALVPAVSLRIFSTWSCRSFGYDDVEQTDISYLAHDMSVLCDEEKDDTYQRLVQNSLAWVVIWPVLVPIIFVALLVAGRSSAKGSAELLRATNFLHAEYQVEFFWWELLELIRKLMLMGFLMFVPRVYALLRIFLAILICILHLYFLTSARPYKDSLTGFAAEAASFVLLIIMVFTLLVYLQTIIPAPIGVDTTTISIIIASFNWSAIALAIPLFLHRVQQTRLKALRVQSTGGPPSLSLATGKQWHLFLSHSWANQDVVAIVKRQLQQLLPGCRVFLDVEDLKEIDALEAHVKETTTLLILLGSLSYFGSKNCLREVAEAETLQLPLILLHDAETSKGGSSLKELQHACRSNKTVPMQGERSAAQLYDFIFGASDQDAREVVPWHRITAFQLVTLTRIAERMLLALPPYLEAPSLPLVLPRELSFEHLLFKPPVVLLVSERNPGAESVAAELENSFTEGLTVISTRDHDPASSPQSDSMPGTPDDSFNKRNGESSTEGSFHETHSRKTSFGIRGLRRQHTTMGEAVALLKLPKARYRATFWSRHEAQSSSAALRPTHFLLYLNASTFVGDDGALAEEVRAIRATGLPIVLVHERDPAAGGCDFNNFFRFTPPDLLEGGLFGPLATAWYPDPYRTVSMQLVCRALGASEMTWYERLRSRGLEVVGAVESLRRRSLSARTAQSEQSQRLTHMVSRGGLVIEMEPSVKLGQGCASIRFEDSVSKGEAGKQQLESYPVSEGGHSAHQHSELCKDALGAHEHL